MELISFVRIFFLDYDLQKLFLKYLDFFLSTIILDDMKYEMKKSFIREKEESYHDFPLWTIWHRQEIIYYRRQSHYRGA